MKKILFSLSIIWVTCWQVMGAKLSVYSLEDSNNNQTLSRVLLQTGTETLFGAEFIINHDADLGVSSVKSADSVFVSNTSVPGQIKLAIANATGITGDKILVEVKFDKIISDSVISVSNVSLNEGGLTSLGAVDTGVFDQDGDGVLDFDEEEIFNTDPDSKDTDGDGCSDRFEIENSADPNNAASFPTRTLTAENTINGSITSTDTHKLGATATVTAVPALGYLFTAWTGASTGIDNPLTLTMDGNKTIGATFTKDTADTDGDGFSNHDELVTHKTDPLDASSYPTRTLTAVAATNGSITSTETHKLGATTTVTAVPALGYLFTAWTSASTGTNNPLTLTMDGDKTIGATFTKDTADTDGDGFSNHDELVTHKTDPSDASSYPTRTLTAVAVTNGSITSTETHKLGATTTVTAVPALGYLFTAWTGASSGTNNPLTLTMDGNKTIGATFTKDTADTDGDGFSNHDELVTHKTDPADTNSYPIRTLTAVVVTNGSITSTETHKLGETTTVTAVPALGYLFTAWTSASTGTDNPLTLTMDGNKTIGATFAKDTADTDGDGFSNYDELVTHETDPADANNYPTRTLTAVAATNGSISSTETHKLGETTTVTAVPALGYLFTAWTGASTGIDNPLTLAMDGDKTIGATFTKDTADTDGDGFSNHDELVTHKTDPSDASSYPTRTLTAVAATNGSITSTETHKLGATTTVTAVPALGYLFTAWTGASSGTNNPLTLTMDGNKTIGATFTKDTADTDGDGFSNYDELVTYSTNPADNTSYPTRKLTAVVATNGSITSTDTHKLGATTTVTATPNLGYVFTAWTGASSGTNNPLTLTMDGNKTIGAAFAKDTADTDGDGFSNYDELVTHETDPADANNYPTRTLTAVAATNGSITSTETHKLGATTTVTAVPALGYLFTAWTSASTGANNPLTLTMDGNKTIGATFTKDTADTDGDGFSNHDELVTHKTDPSDASSYPTRTLTAVAATNGSITFTDTHKLGATTTVTAVPALGYLFTAWTSASTGTNNPLTLTMDGNKTIGATFAKDTADTDGDGFSNHDELVTHKTDPSDASSYPTRTLTAVAVTNGSITSTETHKLGATTTVTAVPVLGYLFTAWTGASSGTNNPLTLTMNGNKTIGATFTKDTADTDGDGFSNYDELVTYSTNPADNTSYPTRKLTAVVATNGSITSTDTHKLGATTTVTATPNLGYVFTAWTGASSGTNNPLTLTMDGNKTIGAAFAKDTADTDGDGFSNYDELVTYSTSPADNTSYPTRKLTAVVATNGSITSTETHKLGATTAVTATPNLGYVFTTWTGASSGTNNPLTLTMDGNKTIGAGFTKDTADTDGDGFSNYDELVIHETDPADANSYPGKTLDLNLNISRSGNAIILEWENGKLQKSLNLEQGFINVTDEDGDPVTSPYQIEIANKREFFRVSE